ncbi:MAG: hypothetical protein QNJ22_07720 [Desulfosarcinaceae bacterium]|nr:hypothetical protein [Desulfosarcinaceae bacterium]
MAGCDDEMTGIGQLNEKPLHAALKAALAQPGDRFEVSVDGYIVDIVREDLLVEIQTGNFAAIKTKLAALVRHHPLRLIYPIAREKWILKPAPKTADTLIRRKSPKRGRLEDLFHELIRIPHLLAHPNFSLEIVLTREEERRRFAGKRHWRKRGWVTDERRLLEVVARQAFQHPSDLMGLLPTDLEERFTTQSLAAALGIGRPLAQRMTYCLRHLNLIEMVGKHHRFHLYTRAASPQG